MEQLDHMIDMMIILSINFCPCKIRYQVKILWDQRKAIKKGLSAFWFFKLKKEIFLEYIFL